MRKYTRFETPFGVTCFTKIKDHIGSNFGNFPQCNYIAEVIVYKKQGQPLVDQIHAYAEEHCEKKPGDKNWSYWFTDADGKQIKQKEDWTHYRFRAKLPLQTPEGEDQVVECCDEQQRKIDVGSKFLPGGSIISLRGHIYSYGGSRGVSGIGLNLKQVVVRELGEITSETNDPDEWKVKDERSDLVIGVDD